MTQRGSNGTAWLSPFQRRIVSYSVVCLALTVLLAIAALAIWVLVTILSKFSSLLGPLAIAGVLALVLHPVAECLHGYLRVPRSLAAGLLVAVMCIAPPLALWWIGPLLIDQLVSLYGALEGFVAQLYERLSARFPATSEYVRDRLEEVDLTTLMPPAGEMFKTVGAYITLLVALGFLPLFLFFFLLAGSRMEDQLTEVTSMLNVELQKEVHYLVSVFFGYVAAFFQGQLVIALIMAILFSVGFTIIGLDAALPLGIISGLLNIVPFLGTLLSLLLVLPYAFFQDGAMQLLLAAGVIGLVQLVESWFLTPRIMSERSGLHPAVVVFSLFFWGTVLGGIIGVVLAVPLSAFAATIWKHFRSRYFSRVVSQDGHLGERPEVDDTPSNPIA